MAIKRRLKEASDDSTLRLYRNAAPVAPGAAAVQVGAFAEALGSPWQLAPGAPTSLRLSDVNGDGSLDAVAWVEDVSGGVRSTSVGTAAVYRFARPVCYQNFPESSLPPELRNRNERGIWRLVNNELTKEDISL